MLKREVNLVALIEGLLAFLVIVMTAVSAMTHGAERIGYACVAVTFAMALVGAGLLQRRRQTERTLLFQSRTESGESLARKRDISAGGLREAFFTVVLVFMIAGVILDRRGRGTDAFGAGIIFLGLAAGRVNPDRIAAVRARRARRQGKSESMAPTARRRRAVLIVVTMFVYGAIRPVPGDGLVAAIAYSLLFCGLIFGIAHMQKQHVVTFFRRLIGRLAPEKANDDRLGSGGEGAFSDAGA